MDRLAEFTSRLERTQLQLKALQRTARTTLQVTTDLLQEAEELREELTHSPKEGTANGDCRDREAVST